MKSFLFAVIVLTFWAEFSKGEPRHHHHDKMSEEHGGRLMPKSRNYARKISIINGGSGVHKPTGALAASGSFGPSGSSAAFGGEIKIPDSCQKVVSDLKAKELRDKEKALADEAAKPKINEKPITTQLLDSTTGKPASNLKIETWKLENEKWTTVSETSTDEHGSVTNAIAPDKFSLGIYKLHFDTKAYYGRLGLKTLYPYIDIVFEVTNIDDSFHIAMAIGPYGYTTYRGD